jgi:hypothetical protein
MILPVMTALVIVFIVWINYEMHKTTKLSKEATKQFWSREKSSELMHRSDITVLDYIIVTTKSLPMSDCPDPTVNSYRDIILKLSDMKALNLSGYTNTELKLRYGNANISLLTECDNNYTVLVSIMQKWAVRLNNLGYSKDAIAVLEYAVVCHTDVNGSYLLLAELYRQNAESEKIRQLINTVSNTRLRNKDKLTNKLSQLLEQKFYKDSL